VSNEQPDYMPQLVAQLQATPGQPALELLGRAADDHPADPRPLLLLAAEYMHLEKVDNAEAAYILALQRAPGYAIARFQLGLLQFTSARPAAAFATWAPLEGLPDGDPLLLFKRGLEALGQDRFQDARRWLLAGIGANTVNEALNRDMRMVIERMVQMGVLDGAGPTPPAGSPPPAPPAQPGPEQGQEHFLVSAYGRKA